jgi:hypothetical protein
VIKQRIRRARPASSGATGSGTTGSGTGSTGRCLAVAAAAAVTASSLLPVGPASAATGWIPADISNNATAAASAPMGFNAVSTIGLASIGVTYTAVDEHVWVLESITGTSWQGFDLTSIASGVPVHALGRPYGYLTSLPGETKAHVRVVYLGKNDHHIHEVSRAVGGSWADADLTLAAAGSHTPAAGAPMGFAIRGSDPAAHVVFRDVHTHVHDLHLAGAGTWADDDLNDVSQSGSAPDAGGEPMGFVEQDFIVKSQFPRVVYPDSTGNLNQFNGFHSGGLVWGNGPVGGAPNQATPMGYVTVLGKRVFVRRISVANKEIIENFAEQGGSHAAGQASLTVAGSGTFSQPGAMGYQTELKGALVARVVYTSACPAACAGHLHELNLQEGGSWHDNDLTATFGGLAALSAPFGWQSVPLLGAPTGARVVYRAANGHIEELRLV